MSDFLKVIQSRRSIYGISKDRPLPACRIRELVEQAVVNAPSAFNMQEARAVLLMGEHHEALWGEILPDVLRPLVPQDKFGNTQKKLAGFQGGYGTVLFYEDTEVTKTFMEKFPLYRDNFPVWAQHGSGILQILLWELFTNEGLGANLQHYNPLIDERVAEKWGIPASWQLIAQMPFGTPTAPAGEKRVIPPTDRMKIFL